MMKKILLLFVLAFGPLTSMFAFDCEVDGIYYNRLSADEFEVTKGNNKYSGDISIPETVMFMDKVFKVTQVGNNAFGNCTGLTSVSLPNSITSLSDYCFSGCTSLETISIPSSVKTIGSRSFQNCKSLLAIVIPEGVTHIPDYTFSGCSKMVSITLPHEITSIWEGAFAECSSLITVKLPTQITQIDRKMFLNCTSLTSIDLPEGLTSIGEDAFRGCVSLTEVSIPPSVTSIVKNAYMGCKELKKVVVKDMAAWCNIQFGSAESNPLYYAKHLYSDENTEIKDLVLPVNITSISSYAFYGADNFQQMHVISDTPPTLGTNTFYGNNIYTWTDVYVPTGSEESYHNNYSWNQFKSISEFDPSTLGYVQIKLSASGNGNLSCDNFKVKNGNKSFYFGIGNTISLKMNADSNHEVGNFVINGNNCDSIKYESETLCSYDCNVDMNHSFEVRFVQTPAVGSTFIDNNMMFKRTSEKEVMVTAKSDYSGEIIIPASIRCRKYTVTRIDQKAFANCSGLTSISIPNSIISIGENAFYICEGLQKVIINDIDAWCRIGFANSASNPTYYAKHLYNDDNTEITEVIIPWGIPRIQECSFINCREITAITIPNSVTSIGGSAFSGCIGLTSIEIPNSVTFIGSGSFTMCKSLTSISIPNSVTEIDASAFYGCSGISTPIYNAHCFAYLPVNYEGAYIIPDGIKLICGGAFLECKKLTSVDIPNSVTGIARIAFWNCSGLSSINIPNSVTSISTQAFQGCTSLTSLIIPNSVKYIGSSAFSNCTSLTSLTLSETLTMIYDGAFYGCTSLNSITSLNPTPPELESNAFTSFSATLYVPIGSKGVYKTANIWKNFSDIQELRGKEYTITYYVDGTVYKVVNYYENDVVEKETAPTKEGYTFSGWSEIPDEMPAHDVTITGSFIVNKYKVRYYDGDKLIAEDEVEYGAEVVLRDYTPEDTNRYIFIGWDGEKYETMPAHDIEYHANIADGVGQLAGMPDGVEAIYDANGRKLSKMQRGVNILLMSDGTKRKLIVK